MSDPVKNVERRSDAAVLCVTIGAGLLALAWFFGFFGVFATALSGGWPAFLAGGITSLVLMPLTVVLGGLFFFGGALWMIGHVIVDQLFANDKYSKDVER